MTRSKVTAEHSDSAIGTGPHLEYLTGFGNEFLTEAIANAVPRGRNSPQRHPLGLYAELLSGTAFTVPRHRNRRTWTYRIRPSASHPAYERIPHPGLHRPDPAQTMPEPNRIRWSPLPWPDGPVDFVDGLWTYAANGDPLRHEGIAVHAYHATRDMQDRYFVDADGELLLVPRTGTVQLHTELGILEARPGEIAVVPRGMRFRVTLPTGRAAGYVCENHGSMFELPELGPIGSNGLADPRDFRTPVAAFEDREVPVELVQKFAGHLWRTHLTHSPLDVVGWHGTLVPYVYDTAHFMTLGAVSFDHPDPSIFTVLTSPTTDPGLANVDFVIFPPRWVVAEDTFRPPWFHRNVMTEFMGLIYGSYDAKAHGFEPGAASLHTAWTSHGPDAETFAAASAARLAPERMRDSLAFMFETRLPLTLSPQAATSTARQPDYDSVWSGLRRIFAG